MEKLKNLEDLFLHELKDLYSAESQLLKALPDMVDKASDPQLKNSLKMHLAQTREQHNRLSQIAGELNIEPDGQKCQAMAGLIKEGENLLDEKANPATKDAAIIAAAQKIEHYEIASYGTARYYAKMLGKQRAEDLLRETLNEEKATNEKLNSLAENKINLKSEYEGTRDATM
jgi:ferritin-like metal-binding protein YciE